MSKAIKKSSAPLFIAFGSNPNYNDPATSAMTKDEMMEHDETNDAWTKGFEQGEIYCELTPLGFFYNDADEVIQGEVKKQELVNMLVLQGDIYDGVHPPVEIG